MKEKENPKQEECFDYIFDDTEVTLENLYVFIMGEEEK